MFYEQHVLGREIRSIRKIHLLMYLYFMAKFIIEPWGSRAKRLYERFKTFDGIWQIVKTMDY